MEINKNELYDALQNNPEQITEIARQIANALGIPAEKAIRIAQNTDLISAKLSHMTENDIQNMVSVIGEDNANAILSKIRSSGNG